MAKRQTLFQAKTNWTDLGIKSFAKLHVCNWHGSNAYTFKLAGLKPSFADTSSDPADSTDGIMIYSQSIAANTTVVIENVSVSSITSTIGADKDDDWFLMAASSSDTSKISLLIEV